MVRWLVVKVITLLFFILMLNSYGIERRIGYGNIKKLHDAYKKRSEGVIRKGY